MIQQKISDVTFYIAFIILVAAASENCTAQEQNSPVKDRDTLLFVAREYIQSVRYCALVTTDSTGYPHVRVMDPFQPNEEFVVWMGTNRYSRKVKEIAANPKVTLFYYDDEGNGYVSIEGNAYPVDDEGRKKEYWKTEWENFYQNRNDYILIKVIPRRLDILSYKDGLYGDRRTWRTPSVYFNQQK